MWMTSIPFEPTLRQLVIHNDQQKIPALPLQFQYFPVEILSKQFTKLNSNHAYRIHYLGPRPLNTLLLHRRYGKNQDTHPKIGQKSVLWEIIKFQHYKVNLKKIINCNFMSEKLQENHHYKSAIFYRAFEGMNPTLPLKQQFVFNSAFQSGNLDCVIKVKSNEFDLFLRIDSNTRGHTAWYYFSIKNSKRLETVTLNICNFNKSSTLYEQGMKPFIFSKRSWQNKQKGWEQDINECKIEEARLRYEFIYESINVSTSFRLTFDFQFQYEDDEVFFAYSIPYTYSQMHLDLIRYQLSPFVRKETIGKSLSGLQIPVLHITNHENRDKKKKNVIITGRVHPCQTNSSHMLNGFINFLLDNNNKDSEQIRKKANFFIIPMLNPDGVVLGNSRTSAAGKDLNRQFMTNKKELYPQIIYLKSFSAKMQKKYGVSIYIDFHGHSRKKNTFLYGPNYPINHPYYYRCRAFPKLIEKVDPKFRFYSSSFHISEQKKTTARAVMLNQLKIPYSYTIQSSIGLFYDPQLMKTLPFQKNEWNQMGQSIGNGLCSFIQVIIELQSLVKERKAQREKQKQQKQLKTVQRLNKLKQDQIELLTKSKKGNLFLQIMQQVKIATAQLKNFEDEVQSDDHDDKQDLQNYKLAQFNNLVTKVRKRQKIQDKVKVQQQEQDFQIALPVLEEQEQTIFQKQTPEEQKKTAIKNPHPENKQKRSARTFKTISQIRKNEEDSEKIKRYQSHQQKSQKKSKEMKNFVTTNKQRYSLATKNLFPIEDRCQMLALPKSIQIMRKQMKKGRMLINNLVDSRVKFLSVGVKQQNQVKKEVKMPFLLSEYSRFRIGSRSSTGYINNRPENDIIDVNDVALKKSETYLKEAQSYLTLTGFEVDNLAMTITTFKRPK